MKLTEFKNDTDDLQEKKKQWRDNRHVYCQELLKFFEKECNIYYDKYVSTMPDQLVRYLYKQRWTFASKIAEECKSALNKIEDSLITPKDPRRLEEEYDKIYESMREVLKIKHLYCEQYNLRKQYEEYMEENAGTID